VIFECWDYDPIASKIFWSRLVFDEFLLIQTNFYLCVNMVVTDMEDIGDNFVFSRVDKFLVDIPYQ